MESVACPGLQVPKGLPEHPELRGQRDLPGKASPDRKVLLVRPALQELLDSPAPREPQVHKGQ